MNSICNLENAYGNYKPSNPQELIKYINITSDNYSILKAIHCPIGHCLFRLLPRVGHYETNINYDQIEFKFVESNFTAYLNCTNYNELIVHNEGIKILHKE